MSPEEWDSALVPIQDLSTSTEFTVGVFALDIRINSFPTLTISPSLIEEIPVRGNEVDNPVILLDKVCVMEVQDIGLWMILSIMITHFLLEFIESKVWSFIPL